MVPTLTARFMGDGPQRLIESVIILQLDVFVLALEIAIVRQEEIFFSVNCFLKENKKEILAQLMLIDHN